MSPTQLLDALLAITGVLQADQDRELERRGLTVARTHLLWVLHHQGSSTQAALADALGVTPRYVTTLVDALDATGLAERLPHPSDRRAVLVSLTKRGETTMAAMAEEHVAFAAALVEGLDQRTIDAAVIAIDHARGRLEALIAEHERRQLLRDEGS
jgi:DNA-binding MarR family transcriptional regulator